MSPYVLGLPAYPMAQVIGMLLAIGLAFRFATTGGLPAHRVLTALAVLALAAVAGAVLSAPSFRPTAGFRYPGVGIAVVAALPLVLWALGGSISLLAFGDLMAAPLAFGLAVSKLACFFHGCCHGPPSTLPWAIAFPRRSIAWWHHVEAGLISTTAKQSLPVHPLQLYCVAWACFVGMLLVGAKAGTMREGQQLQLVVALIAVGYFVTERFQVPRSPQTQVWSLVVALLAAVAFLVLAKRGRVPRRLEVVVPAHASVPERVGG